MEVFKSAGKYIVKLRLLPMTKHNMERDDVIDKKYAKFRCNEAFVVSITHKMTHETINNVASKHDRNFIYYENKIVCVTNYDMNEHIICSTGIHFYLSRECAFYYDIDSKHYTGSFKEWYNNGQLRLDCHFKNGQYDGLFKLWNESGKIQKNRRYKNGIDTKY